MTNYLIESSICLACFYTFYWLVLRNEKLLSINRAYLIITAVLALGIPLVNIDLGLSVTNPVLELANQATINTSQAELESTQVPSITFGNLYLVGLVVASLLLLSKFFILRRKLGTRFSLSNKQVHISETEGYNAYSFFNTVYLGQALIENEKLKSDVLAHELAHIKGKHSLDIFFFEVIRCLFWFNPFSYFYLKSIKLQHEYIADDQALKLTNARSYEKSLLELTLSKLNTGLVSSFSEHPIQKRLNMIQKLNSNVMKKFKPLYVVPILGLLVFGFACTQDPEIEPASIDEPKSVVDESMGETEVIVESAENTFIGTVVEEEVEYLEKLLREQYEMVSDIEEALIKGVVVESVKAVPRAKSNRTVTAAEVFEEVPLNSGSVKPVKILKEKRQQ